MPSLTLKLTRLLLDTLYQPTERCANKPSHILILRDENKLGDMVITTGLIDHLYQAGMVVSVAAGPLNRLISENLPQVRHTFIIQPSRPWRLASTIKQLRKQQFDLVLDFSDHISAFHYALIAAIGGKQTLGFNKSQFKRYDITLSADLREKHICWRYQQVLHRLDIPCEHYSYLVPIPPNELQRVGNYLLQKSHQKVVVINPFAADHERFLSILQVNAIIKQIQALDKQRLIIIIGPPNLIRTLNLARGAISNPFQTLWSAAAWVKYADLVISPDTAWVHIAKAFQRPLIAFYNNKILPGGLINKQVWAPDYQPSTQLVSHDRLISSIPVSQIEPVIRQYLTPS